LFICTHFISSSDLNSNIYKALYNLEHALSQGKSLDERL
jgi:hypothetical protein